MQGRRIARKTIIRMRPKKPWIQLQVDRIAQPAPCAPVAVLCGLNRLIRKSGKAAVIAQRMTGIPQGKAARRQIRPSALDHRACRAR